MAKISVKERDLSWYYRQRQRGALTVYMPGLSTFGPYKPTYVTEDNFAKIFGGPIGYKKDYSYYIAASFLKSGIDVLFQRVPLEGAVQASWTEEKNAYIVTITNNKVPQYLVTVTNNDSTALVVSVDNVSYTFPADGTPHSEEFTDATARDTLYAAVLEAVNETADPTKYVVETSNISNDLELTVNGAEYTFPSDGETTTYAFSMSQKDDVDTALAAVSSDTDYEIITEEKTSSFTLKAKYEGTLGNALKVVIKSGGNGLRYFYTYRNGALVEQLIVDFIDPLSQYYYESIESGYLSFDDAFLDGEEFDPTMMLTVPTEATLKGGLDYGATVNPMQNALDTIISTEEDFFKEIKNPYGYYYDILVNGNIYYVPDEDSDSYTTDPNKDADKLFAEVAQKSGVAVYLVGGLETTEPTSLIEWCKDLDTSYASGIGPWCLSTLVSEGSRVWLPGWYAQLVEWGNSCSKGNPVWYAPAGVNRAKVGSVVSKTAFDIGEADLALWQNQDELSQSSGGYKVNPIMNLKQYGYCIYGNSTLLHSRVDGSTSMLQSLGTRVLVNQIKARAFEVALGLQFDQMSDNLFMAFRLQMGSYMDQLKYQGGLYDYQIILDTSTVTYDDLNQKTVPVIIRISPNPAAENFNILCEVYPSGITFTDELDESSIQIQ